ncbi:MAG: hypothetical protein OSJ67_07545 [Clostridia bacterium]|nr:hypothetical protein [Clostridia bacterium]
MRNVFYFGRKNHYGVRLIKNVKNMCDCVSGYITRHYNVDTIERLGSSPNILADKNNILEKTIIKKQTVGDDLRRVGRLERTYQSGGIIMMLSEPLLGEPTVSLKVVTDYNASFETGDSSRYQYDGKLELSPAEYNLQDLNRFLDEKRELDLSFNNLTNTELSRIPDRSGYLNSNYYDDKTEVEKDISEFSATKLTAFKLYIDYKILTKMLYYNFHREPNGMPGIEYDLHGATLEQCRAKSFYFVVEGKTMRKEKTKFRFTLDKDGNLIEPPAGFHPISELPLAENPFLTADAIYRSDEGDIPLYQWVAKNYLTKYKRIRKELEFEKALTPMYLTKEFYTDPEYRLDRPIRNGDYISITDEFGDWMGGTLGDSIEQSFFNGIKDKYDKYGEAKAKEIAEHPLIYRVMNTNTKVKNDVGYQKCECLEVINLDEIEEIFV